MSKTPGNNSLHEASTPPPRRALIIAETAGLGLQKQLTSSGYLTRSATVADALDTIKEFGPDVIIMVVAHAGESENESVALGRKLRAETSTYSLPIAYAWVEDEHSLRAAAQYIGADDYFPLATPPAEILARLDSLFWRVDADRRSASVMSDRRLEIDNFMFMLDAVREDVRAGVTGTLALIYAVAPNNSDAVFDKTERDHTLSDAHNFLKLNLRRIDAVSFYGPTMLLVYLHRMGTRSALAALSRLHREFQEEHPKRDLVAGLATFPGHGSDVEALIENAERAVSTARRDATTGHVIAYQGDGGPTGPGVEISTERIEAHGSEKIAEPASGPPAPGETDRTGEFAKDLSVTGGLSVTDTHVEAIANEEDGRRAAAAAESERERRASGAIMPRRLLLTISDSARMAQVNSLIRSAGYEARAAFDGEQALHLLKIERPDLLLLDFELQGIDGVETIRRLRKQSGGRLVIPVVMLLSSANDEARRQALELGAHSVLVTPYDPADFLANVRVAGNAQ